MTDLPPELRDRFEVLTELGEGGMGAVLLAHDRELDREVAIKLVLGEDNEKIRTRFLREAETLARIQSPHVVKLFDFGVAATGPYLVMEALEGDSLDNIVLKDPLPPMLDAARGLETLHREGLVHRDVKPGNIIRLDSGRGVLIDLGLVLLPEATQITRTGGIPGTAPYLAPERYDGAPAGPPSDWYAWGVTLFFLRERRLPYQMREILMAAHGKPFPRIEFRKIDATGNEAQLLRACLEPNPNRRPDSVATIEAYLAGEVEDIGESPTLTVELPAISDSDPSLGARLGGKRLPVLLLGMALAVGLGAGFAVSREEPAPRAPAPATEGAEGPGYARVVSDLEKSLATFHRFYLGDRELLPEPWGSSPEEYDLAFLEQAYPHLVDPVFGARWKRFLDRLAAWLRVRPEVEAAGELDQFLLLEDEALRWGTLIPDMVWNIDLRKMAASPAGLLGTSTRRSDDTLTPPAGASWDFEEVRELGDTMREPLVPFLVGLGVPGPATPLLHLEIGVRFARHLRPFHPEIHKVAFVEALLARPPPADPVERLRRDMTALRTLRHIALEPGIGPGPRTRYLDAMLAFARSPTSGLAPSDGRILEAWVLHGASIAPFRLGTSPRPELVAGIDRLLAEIPSWPPRDQLRGRFVLRQILSHALYWFAPPAPDYKPIEARIRDFLEGPSG